MTASSPPPADDQVREAAVEAVARWLCTWTGVRLGDRLEDARTLLALPAVSALVDKARADELDQAGTELAHDHRHYVEIALSGADYVQQWLADRATNLRAAIRQTEGNNQ